MQVELKYFSLYYNVIFINHPLIQNSINSKKNFQDKKWKITDERGDNLKNRKKKEESPWVTAPSSLCLSDYQPPNTNTSLVEYQVPNRLSRHRNKPHKSWLKED